MERRGKAHSVTGRVGDSVSVVEDLAGPATRARGRAVSTLVLLDMRPVTRARGGAVSALVELEIVARARSLGRWRASEEVDMVGMVVMTFEDYKKILWVEIDTDALTDECKKLSRQCAVYQRR